MSIDAQTNIIDVDEIEAGPRGTRVRLYPPNLSDDCLYGLCVLAAAQLDRPSAPLWRWLSEVVKREIARRCVEDSDNP